MEAVRSGRKFMRRRAPLPRNKPVLIIKAGRVPEGAKAATSHTGALAGADDIGDAAIRRPACCACIPPRKCSMVETLACAAAAAIAWRS
ncbi:hypothetical protein ACU4GD_16795 [Cupriavidus basilensis]